MTNTVNLWHGRLSEDIQSLQHYWQLLDTAEQSHASSIKNKLQQSLYVQTHALLRMLLAEMIDENPHVINIGKGEHGKPFLLDYPEIAFNLSHTADYLLIGIAQDCRLGVDVEFCKPRTNFAGFIRKCFAESEAAHWHQLPEQQKVREFYRFWTAKEAFVKATGRGIGLGLQQCVLNADLPFRFESVPAEYGSAATWQVQEIDLEPGLCAAMVSNKSNIKSNISDLADVLPSKSKLAAHQENLLAFRR